MVLSSCSFFCLFFFLVLLLKFLSPSARQKIQSKRDERHQTWKPLPSIKNIRQKMIDSVSLWPTQGWEARLQPRIDLKLRDRSDTNTADGGRKSLLWYTPSIWYYRHVYKICLARSLWCVLVCIWLMAVLGGPSLSHTDWISISGLASKSKIHTQTYTIRPHTHTHTNTRSHPFMQSQTHTHTGWDVILSDSTGVYKAFFGGLGSSTGLYNYKCGNI